MKKCPFCAEEIQSEAIKCRYCGERLEVPSYHHQITPQLNIHDSNTVSSIAVPTFRDPSKLTRWLKYSLYASILIAVIQLFSYILQYQLLLDFKLGVYSSEALATAAAESNDKRQRVIGLFQFGIAIVTIILFAMWIYRANFNVRQLGAKKMKFTPGWSVGYYFIPFLNLWRPYQAMKEIWCASKNPKTWESIKRGAILPWWWLFFIVYCMLGTSVFKSSLRATEINEIFKATGMAMVTDVVGITAIIIAVILVKQIYSLQMSALLVINKEGIFEIKDSEQTIPDKEDKKIVSSSSSDTYKKFGWGYSWIIWLLLALLIALTIVGYYFYTTAPKRITRYESISLGMTVSEVKYKKGVPSEVSKKLDNDTLVYPPKDSKTGLLDFDSLRLEPDHPKGSKDEDFDIWRYWKNNRESVDVKFDVPNGHVVYIACVSKTDRCEKVNDIGINSTEINVKKRFGKPSKETFEGLVKKIEYKDYNLEFHLAKEKVYYVIVRKLDD